LTSLLRSKKGKVDEGVKREGRKGERGGKRKERNQGSLWQSSFFLVKTNRKAGEEKEERKTRGE